MPASSREPIVPAPKRGASSAAQTSSAGRAPPAVLARKLVRQLEPEHRAERAVVAAAVGDRVDVRAGADERPVPARRQRPEVAVAVDRGLRPASRAQPATSSIACGLGGGEGRPVGAAAGTAGDLPERLEALGDPSGVRQGRTAASGFPSIASTSG